MNASGLVNAMKCSSLVKAAHADTPQVVYFSCGMNASDLLSAMKCFGCRSVSAVLELKH